MKEVSIIGVDFARQVLQLHGATVEGDVVFRKKLSRKLDLSRFDAAPLIAFTACMDAPVGARHF